MSEDAETLGQRLKAERERKGLSAQKVADELHLDGWVIEALESDDYGRIGPAVYGKGHLKRYIGLLGLPAADILQTYDARSSAPVSTAPPATLRLRTATAAHDFPWGLLGVLVLGVVIIGGLLWWRPWQPRAAMPSAAAARAPRPAPPAQSAAPSQAVAPSEGTGEGSHVAGNPADAVANAATTPVVAKPAAAAVQTDADSGAGLGHVRLRLSFSADSWVDLHDASGRRLFSGNGRANSVKTVAGDAPIKVYLRSASGVQLEVNNHTVAIGRQFVAGHAARFEAGADGVLRRDPSAAAISPRPRG